MDRKWQKAAAAVFWLLALGAYALYSYQHQMTPLETLRRLADYLRESELGPVLFIIVYTVRPVFLFSAALLTVGAGALFGTVWGVVYSIVGSNLGASLAYLIGRFFGDDLAQVGESEQGLGKWVQGLRENSFETVFIMRLLFLPYDLVNYLAGFLRIHFGAFLLATALGSLPGTVSFALFGAASGLDDGTPNFDWRILAASIAIFIFSLLVSRWMRRKRGKEGD